MFTGLPLPHYGFVLLRPLLPLRLPAFLRILSFGLFVFLFGCVFVVFGISDIRVLHLWKPFLRGFGAVCLLHTTHFSRLVCLWTVFGFGRLRCSFDTVVLLFITFGTL